MTLIKIGKIVNTHGIKGELRLLSKFPYKDKVFINNMNIYINKKDEEVINTYRRHKNFDMITLKGYNNINEVLKYKGKYVYVNDSDIKLDNNKYLDEFSKHNMIASGINADKNLVEILELKDHPYFIACQFHPEFLSRPIKPHPLFLGFIEEANKYKNSK